MEKKNDWYLIVCYNYFSSTKIQVETKYVHTKKSSSLFCFLVVLCNT